VFALAGSIPAAAFTSWRDIELENFENYVGIWLYIVVLTRGRLHSPRWGCRATSGMSTHN
jgi:hypothetical protein